MARYVALLRGVNVGPHNRIRMADFRAGLEALGFTAVRTYVNSGNAVFTADTGADASELATAIHDELVSAHGLDVPVIVRTSEDLRNIIERNPFPEQAATPKLLHVTFLAGVPDPARVAALDSVPKGLDDFRVDGSVVYLHYPNGLSRATFMPAGLDRALGVPTTSRNWSSVLALAALAADKA